MRFKYDPHRDEHTTVAYGHPVLDLHDNVLISSELVSPDHPRSTGLIIKPGDSFDINESNFPAGYYAAAFFKAHSDFQTVSTGRFPETRKSFWFDIVGVPEEVAAKPIERRK